MRRASVAAAGFALADGLAADPGLVVRVSQGPDRYGRMFLACVEPLDLTSRGYELAAVVLRALSEGFAATPGTAADALLAAFAIANAAVITENRPVSGGRWEQRACVGATGVALAGREIVVAQAAPTQALLVQDGQLYAFPDVASWRGDYVPSIATVEGHPLGLTEEHVPRLFFSEAAPGDLVALCSTSVGRIMGRDEDIAFELYRGSLLTGDLEGSVDRLERLLAGHDVFDAFAVVASFAKLPRPTPLQRVQPRPQPTSARANHAGAHLHQASRRSATALTTSDALVDVPAPAFEGVRDGFIKVAERLSSRRRSPVPRFDARQRAMAAPGALSVSRYRESSGLPPEWRANLPRGPMVHVPARLLAVSFVLFLALGGTGFAVTYERGREAHAAAALAAADTALRGAVEIPGSATSLVSEAEGAIRLARASGAAGDALASREQELARIRDQVWEVQRLSDVARLGALPDERTGAGPVRMAISGSTLYLAAGDLYELAPEGDRLITLLEQGDEVAEGVAGDVRHVSIDGGKVVASDGAATYVRDETGQWHRHELAISDIGELREDLPVIAWGDAAYALSWDGNIVRFEETPGGSIAENWAEAEVNPDLALARDLAIDGRIHVLLQDGRTLTFSRGALTGTISPFVVPTLKEAAFLAQAPFATDFYIVDPQTAVGQNLGRIIRVDASGNAQQYLTPNAVQGALTEEAVEAALSMTQDMTIDELTGTVYWVASNEIWRASLPRS